MDSLRDPARRIVELAFSLSQLLALYVAAAIRLLFQDLQLSLLPPTVLFAALRRLSGFDPLHCGRSRPVSRRRCVLSCIRRAFSSSASFFATVSSKTASFLLNSVHVIEFRLLGFDKPLGLFNFFRAGSCQQQIQGRFLRGQFALGFLIAV